MTSAGWKLLFSLFIGVLQVADTSFLIRKCCQEGDYLKIDNDDIPYCNKSDEYEYSYEDNATFGFRKYVSELLTPEYPEFPRWIDPKVTLLSATTLAPVSRFLSDQDNESYIEYGPGPPCSSLDMALVRSTDSGYSLLHNGSLMFQTYNGYNVSFPPSSYCADSASFDSGEISLVYIMCPCDYAECIKSCCYTDQVFDIWWSAAHCKHVSTGVSNFRYVFDPSLTFHQYSYPRCSYAEQDHVFYHIDNILWNMVLSRHILSLHYNTTTLYTKGKYDCINIKVSKQHENYEYQLVICEFGEQEENPFFFAVNCSNAVVLLLTLLVFVLTGETNRSKSKIILSHITCVLVAEVCSALFRNDYSSLILDRRLLELYLPYFYTAATLWINVLCFDLAASFRSFWVSNSGRRSNNDRWFLYYNIYVWGVATVIRMLINIFTNGDFEAEYISHFHIPLTCGIVNFFLLSYTVIKIIRHQRQGRILDAENSGRHNAASCFSKHRRLLVHINLLLLMGPPTACVAIIYHIIGPFPSVGVVHDCMKFLRAFSILLFVLLKPRIWILLSNKMKTYFSLFTRKEEPIPRDPRTATTSL